MLLKILIILAVLAIAYGIFYFFCWICKEIAEEGDKRYARRMEKKWTNGKTEQDTTTT